MMDNETPESVIVQAAKIIMEFGFGKPGIRIQDDETPVEENSAEVLNEFAELIKRKAKQAEEAKLKVVA